MQIIKDNNQQLNEVTLATIAKVGVGYLALKQLVKLFQIQKYPNYNRNATRDYANQLVTAKDDNEALIAIVGLLNICATLLFKIDKLRFLGTKIMEVVKSDTLRQYIENEH